MSDFITNLMSNLTLDLEQSEKYIQIELEELEIAHKPINSTINEFYTQTDKLNKIITIGMILDNKLIVKRLLEFTIIYNRVVNLIKLNSSNYKFDLSVNKIDKLTPSNYIQILKNYLSYEQFNTIITNYYYYINKFNIIVH